VALIVFCFVLIVRYFAAHQYEVELITNINLSYTGTLVGLIIILNIVVCYKFYIILKAMAIKGLKFYEWVKIFIISRFLNFHITQGANIYRTIKLKKEYNFSYTRAMSMMVFCTWVELLSLFIFFVIVLTVFQHALILAGTNVLVILILVIIILGFMPFAFNSVLKHVNKRIVLFFWIQNKLENLSQVVVQNIRNVNLLIKLIGLTFVSLIVYTIAVDISFKAIDINLNLAQALIFTVVLLLSRTLNLVPGNIGLAEVVCGYLAESLGMSLGSGVVISGIFRILNYLTLGILGIVLNRGIIKLKATEEENNY